jgi:septal ring factor EnvC (AmiA/AmiB activator)
MRLKPYPLFFMLGLLMPIASAGDDLSFVQKQWKATQQQITHVSQELANLTNSIAGLEKKVVHNEKLIHDRAQTLYTLNQKITSNNAKLTSLQQDYQLKSKQQQVYQEALQTQILLSLKSMKQNDLQLLLSDIPLSEYQRLKHYHRFMTQAQLQEIQSLKNKLNEMLALQQEITDQQVILTGQRAEATVIKNKLEGDYQAHQTAILAYRKAVKNSNKQLSEYQNQSKALANLLEQLKQEQLKKEKLRQAQLKQKQQAKSQKKPESLPPKKTSTFLAKINNMPLSPPLPKIHWKKSLASLDMETKRLAAEQGTPVYAVKAGKVIFSNWLKGLGYLIILDHGHGYMSLYGTNQTLLKAVGDSVTTGEQIAQVGNSGGFLEPGLYFELRKDGQPLNYTQGNWVLAE